MYDKWIMSGDIEQTFTLLEASMHILSLLLFHPFLWVAWPVDPGSQEKRNTEHFFQAALDASHLIHMFILQCQTTFYFKSLMNLCSHPCNFPILTLFRTDKDAYYKPQILLKG